MRKTQFIWLGLVIFCALGRSQTTMLHENCDLSTYGAKDVKEFLAFDADLRAALARQDATAIALLVHFPLRVNEADGGAYSIDDGQSLRHHFAEVFTPQIRDAVLNQKIASIFCKYDEGLSYGDAAEIWVQYGKVGWQLSAVTLSPSDRPAKRTQHAIQMICRTEKHRVLIDTDDKGNPRYRSWSASRSVMQNPDLEIKGGAVEWEGTGACGARHYTFRNATATYKLDLAEGYSEDDNDPPAGAKARLTVEVAGKELSNAWCY